MKPFPTGIVRWLAILNFLLLIPLISISTALSDDLITARVVGVTAGDSLTVIESNNKQVLIRLGGIDCPELGQPFGEQAKEFTSNLCFGKIIMYRMVGIDRFDRTIATVFLEGSTEVNLEILKAGYAWHFKKYAKRQDYADTEAQARRDGVGLWADPKATPPWEWRREKRSSP